MFYVFFLQANPVSLCHSGFAPHDAEEFSAPVEALAKSVHAPSVFEIIEMLLWSGKQIKIQHDLYSIKRSLPYAGSLFSQIPC